MKQTNKQIITLLSERIRIFFQDHQISNKHTSLLVTVSGGIDSVVLLDLLVTEGFDLRVAHCNFSLRGSESDQDELFVKNLAFQYQVPFHSKRFNTSRYAKERGISIEMAARDLRYQWFEELRNEQNCDWTAVAHQAEDQVETLFINLTRGTGLKGLSGISEVSGHIIRPLIKTYRLEIEQYAAERNLSWREDRSNSEVRFHRNRIRNEILPLFEKINPSVKKTLLDNISHLEQARQFVETVICKIRNEITFESESTVSISIEAIKEYPPEAFILFELLQPYGFKSDQIEAIAHALNGISGKQFFSSTHRLVKDRDFLIVSPLQKELFQSFYLDKEEGAIHNPIDLQWHVITSDQAIISSDSNQAFLDAEKIRWPLCLRKWKPGDRFYPLGMKHKKKLSDFLIDEKIGITQKETVWILESNGEIIWVIGHRIDHRYRVTSQTQKVLVLIFVNNFS
ncbi:MAG: tRNA lysidine(34) synthetase TilS [Bacteroidales bacterium]|nr:tRNA lysidine(34) synthetase TilS [Bacteroidales bacterium]